MCKITGNTTVQCQNLLPKYGTLAAVAGSALPTVTVKIASNTRHIH